MNIDSIFKKFENLDKDLTKYIAKKDKEMIDTINLKNYFSYILNTALGKGSGDAVKWEKIQL